MTDDLVRRLRQHDGFMGHLVEEAADEIDRLRAALREATPHIPADLLRRIETMLGVEQEMGRTK